jgi:hypothetical protein
MTGQPRSRGRWIVTVLVAVGVAGASGATPAGADDVLPDLRQEPPSELDVSVVRGRQLLGFRSAVQNVGEGELLLVGSRPNGITRDMRADQIVTQRSGGSRRVTGVGFLRYVPSPDHSHWHYLPFERYELRREASAVRVVRDRKSGFCLGDRYRVEPRVPGAMPAPVYATRCGLNRPGLLTIREGISVGWADDYAAYLDGQHIDVTNVPSGRYLLVHTVNASGRILETSTANNTASVRIALTRSPTGRVRVKVLR